MVKTLITLLIFLSCFTTSAQLEFPEKPTDYVTDVSGLLTKDQKWYLDSTLGVLEKTSGNQFFILIQDSLYGTDLNSAGTQIYNKWGIGQAGKNNGILLALFMNERAYRFEVGYGLEGYLPDLQTYRIGHEVLIPNFKEKKYFEGLSQTILRIKVLLNDEIAEHIYNKLHLNTQYLLQDQAGVLSAAEEKILDENLYKLSANNSVNFYVVLIDDNASFSFDEVYNKIAEPHRSYYKDANHTLVINTKLGVHKLFAEPNMLDGNADLINYYLDDAVRKKSYGTSLITISEIVLKATKDQFKFEIFHSWDLYKSFIPLRWKLIYTGIYFTGIALLCLLFSKKRRGTMFIFIASSFVPYLLCLPALLTVFLFIWAIVGMVRYPIAKRSKGAASKYYASTYSGSSFFTNKSSSSHKSSYSSSSYTARSSGFSGGGGGMSGGGGSSGRW